MPRAQRVADGNGLPTQQPTNTQNAPQRRSIRSRIRSAARWIRGFFIFAREELFGAPPYEPRPQYLARGDLHDLDLFARTFHSQNIPFQSQTEEIKQHIAMDFISQISDITKFEPQTFFKTITHLATIQDNTFLEIGGFFLEKFLSKLVSQQHLLQTEVELTTADKETTSQYLHKFRDLFLAQNPDLKTPRTLETMMGLFCYAYKYSEYLNINFRNFVEAFPASFFSVESLNILRSAIDQDLSTGPARYKPLIMYCRSFIYFDKLCIDDFMNENSSSNNEANFDENKFLIKATIFAEAYYERKIENRELALKQAMESFSGPKAAIILEALLNRLQQCTDEQSIKTELSLLIKQFETNPILQRKIIHHLFRNKALNKQNLLSFVREKSFGYEFDIDSLKPEDQIQLRRHCIELISRDLAEDNNDGGAQEETLNPIDAQEPSDSFDIDNPPAIAQQDLADSTRDTYSISTNSSALESHALEEYSLQTQDPEDLENSETKDLMCYILLSGKLEKLLQQNCPIPNWSGRFLYLYSRSALFADNKFQLLKLDDEFVNLMTKANSAEDSEELKILRAFFLEKIYPGFAIVSFFEKKYEEESLQPTSTQNSYINPRALIEQLGNYTPCDLSHFANKYFVPKYLYENRNQERVNQIINPEIIAEVLRKIYSQRNGGEDLKDSQLDHLVLINFLNPYIKTLEEKLKPDHGFRDIFAFNKFLQSTDGRNTFERVLMESLSQSEKKLQSPEAQHQITDLKEEIIGRRRMEFKQTAASNAPTRSTVTKIFVTPSASNQVE